MNRSDAADRLERLVKRELEEAAREAGSPGEEEIEAYVAGRASAVEREIVESWLADDPALRAEVDALIAMRADVEAGTSSTSPQVAGAADALVAGGRSLESGAARAAEASASRGEKGAGAVASVEAIVRRRPGAPIRAVVWIAVAASLVAAALWFANPERPTLDSERAAGGAGPAGSSRPGSDAPGSGAPGTSGSGAPGETGSGSPGSSAPGAAASSASPVERGAGSVGGSTAAVVRLTIRDGGRDVSLLSTGEIRGLGAVSSSDRSAVARALASGRLEIAARADAVAAPQGTLLSPGTAAGFRVLSPLATAVRTARPTFRWTTVPDATVYRVRIADASLDPIASSPPLNGSSWTPDAALPAGRVLTWQVDAHTPAGVVLAPVPPAPEARFLVLPDADAQALARALEGAGTSDLAKAVILARFGVLDEADAALARLAEANRDRGRAAIAALRDGLSTRRLPR